MIKSSVGMNLGMEVDLLSWICSVSLTNFHALCKLAPLVNKVYEERQVKICPRTHLWTWNGKSFLHHGGIAPWGLYTFDIFVQGASPNDQDSLRSNQLRFLSWAWTPKPSQARGGLFAYEESVAQIAYALGSSRVKKGLILTIALSTIQAFVWRIGIVITVTVKHPS